MKNLNTLMLMAILSITLTGCSMNGSKTDSVDVPKRTAINNQEFSTFFEDDGIKVNWKCLNRDWFPSMGTKCEDKELSSIEITVTTPTGGGTNMSASNAQRIGEEQVRAKLATFIAGETEQETTTSIIGTTNEMQEDSYRNPIAGTEQTADTRPDAPNMNFAVTSNSQSTASEVQTMIRTQAQVVIRGLAFKYNKVDAQLLQVTGVWDKNAAEDIQNKLSPYFN